MGVSPVSLRKLIDSELATIAAVPLKDWVAALAQHLVQHQTQRIAVRLRMRRQRGAEALGSRVGGGTNHAAGSCVLTRIAKSRHTEVHQLGHLRLSILHN